MAKRPLTAADEQAARLRAERESPFRHTHQYAPNGWDQFDPKGVSGTPITPGEPVQLLGEHTRVLHRGMPAFAKKMFHVVRDANGNVQHVSKNSLDPPQASPAEVFHDRRG